MASQGLDGPVAVSIRLISLTIFNQLLVFHIPSISWITYLDQVGGGQRGSSKRVRGRSEGQILILLTCLDL